MRGSLRKKEKLVKESLTSYFNEFHRTMLASLYQHYQSLSQQIETFEQRVAEKMAPYQQQVELLVTIPGVDCVIAWHLIAEMGTDVTVFPSADHFASWAGLVPGENVSAGQQKSTRCRKGNRVLRRVMTQAAWAASHCKKGYLRAFLSTSESAPGLGQGHRGHLTRFC